MKFWKQPVRWLGSTAGQHNYFALVPTKRSLNWECQLTYYLLSGASCRELPTVSLGVSTWRTPEDGYKLLEFNADGPGLLVEAFSINAEVCRDAGKEDPNEGDESILAGALSEAIQAGRDYVGKSARGGANVVVTSAGHCVRDRAIGRYLCQLMEPFSAQYAAIESLAIDADGLYDPGGNRIDVLYRLFPLQLFRNELFQARGTSIGPEMGGAVLRLVERRQLALINPPFSFLLEGKALQALIWNLADSNIFFTEEERRLIARYMLPTYLDPPIDDSAYVVKPSYGAEGDSVTMMAAGGTVMSQAMCTTYSDRPMVYQKHVELPAPETNDRVRPTQVTCGDVVLSYFWKTCRHLHARWRLHYR